MFNDWWDSLRWRPAVFREVARATWNEAQGQKRERCAVKCDEIGQRYRKESDEKAKYNAMAAGIASHKALAADECAVAVREGKKR